MGIFFFLCIWVDESVFSILTSTKKYYKNIFKNKIKSKRSKQKEVMKDESYAFVKGPNNKVSIVGFGSYGEVKLAKNTETDEMVAIKMIHGRNAKDEIDVHHKLNHPNIVRLLNYYYEKDKNTTYMVLEFAEGGSLNDKIKFGYGNLSKDKVKRYFHDICKAVEYLHSLKFMHRDIKPENILLTKDDHAKLCDFGFAAILEYRSTLCGTYQYMAPEMIQEKPYDYKVDIWALGILLFEMVQGTAPFRGECGQDVIGEMKKPIVFSNRFQKQEVDLIKKILRVNAENRPDVSTILQHSFFKDLPKDEPLKVETPSSQNNTSRTYSSPSKKDDKNPLQTPIRSKIDVPVITHEKKGLIEKERQFTNKQFKDFQFKDKELKKKQTREYVPKQLPKQYGKQGKDYQKQYEHKQHKEKEFKPYIPQGAKTNFMNPSRPHMPTSPTYNPNYHQPYPQTTQKVANTSSSYQPTTYTHNTSLHSFRSNTNNITSPTNYQTTGQTNYQKSSTSTVGYGKAMTGISSPTNTQMRGSGPTTNNSYSSKFLNWKKN